MLSLSLSAVFSTGALLLGRAGVHTSRAGTPTAASIAVPEASQLAQLARMTTLSIDTGDLDIIKAYGATGLITDATTNPLFVSQAGLSGDARYIAFVDSAIAYAKKNAKGTEAVLELAMDRLAVELGLEIVKLVPGYVSTEVDIRASFDTAESIARARRIIAMYEAAGVPRSRVLVKLAGTWEGIQAAKVLEKEGITCNITLIFGFIQAVAAAQAGARLSTAFETEAEIDCPETESEIDIHASAVHLPCSALQCRSLPAHRPALPYIALHSAPFVLEAVFRSIASLSLSLSLSWQSRPSPAASRTGPGPTVARRHTNPRRTRASRVSAACTLTTKSLGTRIPSACPHPGGHRARHRLIRSRSMRPTRSWRSRVSTAVGTRRSNPRAPIPCYGSLPVLLRLHADSARPPTLPPILVSEVTIPPSILDQLAATQEPLLRQLTPAAASAACADSIVGDGDISEAEFRFALNADVCATTKMAEGINMFVAETLKLEAALRGKL
jgi:transaldolase